MPRPAPSVNKRRAGVNGREDINRHCKNNIYMCLYLIVAWPAPSVNRRRTGVNGRKGINGQYKNNIYMCLYLIVASDDATAGSVCE